MLARQKGTDEACEFGKVTPGFVLVVGAVISTAVDWNTTHLFDPAWPPHARFHDAPFLMLLDGAAAFGVVFTVQALATA